MNRRSPSLRLALSALLFTLVSSTVLAQGTALLPVSDPAYRDLDRLEELGMLDSAVIGQRPYSYREIGRLVRAARAVAPSIGDEQERALVVSLLATLEQRFLPARPPRLRAVDQAPLTFLGTDARRRGILGFGRLTEATIDPLVERRLGLPAVTGETIALELAHDAEPLSMLAFNARERIEGHSAFDSLSSGSRSELLLGGMRVRAGNVAVMVGREQLAWSQSAGDGLFLASDAPALDQISVSGDHPFSLPWVFRSLGPAQATLAYADLGASQVRSHSRLVVYKVSVRPRPGVELGGTVMNHFGGAGARPASLGDRIIDMLPFVDVFRRHNYADTTQALEVESDKLLGLDGRIRFDRLGGLSVRGEWLIDDFDRYRLGDLLAKDASHTIRIVVPRLLTPAWSLELSAKHTGFRTYTHGQLTNGITTRGRLLGDELGPDAKAFSARVHWMPLAALRLDVECTSAIYSDADYASYFSDPAQQHFVIAKTASRPDELRDRFVTSLLLRGNQALSFRVRAGAERARNSRLSPDGRRSDYVVALSAGLRE